MLRIPKNICHCISWGKNNLAKPDELVIEFSAIGKRFHTHYSKLKTPVYNHMSIGLYLGNYVYEFNPCEKPDCKYELTNNGSQELQTKYQEPAKAAPRRPRLP